MPSGELRRALRAHGHAMSPIVQVGKAGVTDGLIKQVNQALADHELIKVKVGGECPKDRHEVGELVRDAPLEIVALRDREPRELVDLPRLLALGGGAPRRICSGCPVTWANPLIASASVPYPGRSLAGPPRP